MSYKQLFILFLLPLNVLAQQDSILLGQVIPEIVFIEDREESQKVYSPQQIEQIDAKKIGLENPGTTADALQKSGAVMVQMSQSGGGSPIIRGFEANRVLLVVDGVRMNNAIFRSGHLQNSISTSPSMLSKIDVIFGPSSVKYGSDALGGVIHIHTISPKVGQESVHHFNQKYSTVNEGVGLHYDHSWSKGEWAFLQAISINKYGNLKMGENRMHDYEDWGREAHIVDGNEQLETAYNQLDLTQKIRFDANEYLSYLFNMQFSTTSDIPRFDKLNDISNGAGKYAEWYYGPQKRLLMSLSRQSQKKHLLFDEMNNTTAFQQFEESRHSQKVGGSLSERYERVYVFSNTTDFVKSIGYNSLNYGIDLQNNVVQSSANSGTTTRYADGGSRMAHLSAYGQYKYTLNKDSYLSTGVRFTNTTLEANFIDTSTYQLPYTDIRLNNNSLNGSLGFFYNLGEGWEASTALSTGFRSPNVDDVTKVFAKSGYVTVPNDQLKAEYSYNAELSIQKNIGDKSYLSGTYFYTDLKDAIVKKDFELNGQDSLLYDGEYLPIIANTNTQEAFIYGYNLKAYLQLHKNWSTSHSLNYTYGRDKADNQPLDHIPPMYGKSQIRWQKETSIVQLNVLYNARKHVEDYSLNGSDNLNEATIDGNPSWWTLNLSYSTNLSEHISAQVNLENILDVHYKTYSSGISAAGRNLILSLKSVF
jgi:hemoglobin/transferrin/lactoferrin receptor protein